MFVAFKSMDVSLRKIRIESTLNPMSEQTHTSSHGFHYMPLYPIMTDLIFMLLVIHIL